MSEQFYTHGFSPRLSNDAWLITQDDYIPDLNLVYETNFALTNGYMGSRGVLEEGGQPTRPGTLCKRPFCTNPSSSKMPRGGKLGWKDSAF